MDRNSVTGLLLIVLFVILWSLYVGTTQDEQQAGGGEPTTTDTTGNQEQKTTPDTLAQADSAQADTAQTSPDTPPQPTDENIAQGDTSLSDSAREAIRLQEEFGLFAPAAQGSDRVITVTTTNATFKFRTRGGMPQSIFLREFETFDGKPQPVWSADEDNNFSYQMASAGHVIDTKDLFFEPVGGNDAIEITQNNQQVVLRASIGKGKALEQRYTFHPEEFHVDYQFSIIGLGEELKDNSYVLSATQDVPKTEKSLDNMRQKTTVVYAETDLDGDYSVDELSAVSDEPEEEKILTSVKWISFKSQFFNTAFIANKSFQSATMRTEPIASLDGVKRLRASMVIPYSRAAEDTFGMKLYFGPNDTYVLNDYDVELDKIVDLGWGPIRYISLGIMAVFKTLENNIDSYGVIILLLAILVKLLVSPLTYRSFLSSARMQVVNKMPEIQELNEKYKEDPTKLQQAKMKFYTQVGVSPFGGCLPLLLQLPVLIAMFTFFPSSIELRQEGFLWATDLSTYDSVLDLSFSIPFYGDHVSLFTLLWVTSQLVYTIIQQKQQSQPAGAPKAMKYLPFIMPVIFLGIFNNYSSGLSYYYLCFNLLTIGQTIIIKQFFIDEEKLQQQIHDTKTGKATKKKKGGGIMGWMQRQAEKREEVMRERQAQQQGRSGRRALDQHRSKQQAKKKKKRKK